MRILVYSHSLQIGGSQINAIDLAAAVRDRGHEVAVFAPDGPLAQRLVERDLRWIPATTPQRPRPSPRTTRELLRTVTTERIDLVHTYEGFPCLEAFFGVHLLRRVPVVATVLAMWVHPFMPRTIPLIVGTQGLESRCRDRGHRWVATLEPPVDTDQDLPGSDGSRFRDEYGLNDAPLVVVVSRLSYHMKLEGLERGIDAVAALAGEHRIQLAVVGGGAAYEMLQERAEAANRRLGQRVIVLTGEMSDPRPAYAAADVVLGMGGSVLRGMAFAKPAIIIGSGSFSRVAAPETIEPFLRDGFYGIGDGESDAWELAVQILELIKDERRRWELGNFGRELISERFSLSRAAETLEALYGKVVDEGVHVGRAAADSVPTAVRLVDYKVRNMPRWSR